MKRVDDFQKLSAGDSGQISIFGNPLVIFRLKTLINLIFHLIFALLYAFEHNHQVTSYSDALSVQSAAVNSEAMQ